MPCQCTSNLLILTLSNNKRKLKKILITGGLGFVGGRLTKKLSGQFEVIVSSRKPVNQNILELHGNVSAIFHKDILSEGSFPKNIDTIIHLVALNEWDCVKFPSEAIRVNIDETRIILENAIAAGVKNFIYFSTAHIYANPLIGKITEETLPVPVHPYAITHKAAEDYVMAATLQKKIHGLVVRLSNSFGAPVSHEVNRWTLLANDLCRQAVEKESLTLLSNGCQYRDFICLTDVEDVVETMVKRPSDFKKIIYNLGAGQSMRVIDMAKQIAAISKTLFGKEIKIHLPAQSEPSDEPSLLFSIERLLSEGCEIKNRVEHELRELLLFCEHHFTKA